MTNTRENLTTQAMLNMIQYILYNSDFAKKNRKEERYSMKKQYQEVALELVLVMEDMVRCSNEYSVGDDTKEDIFD